MKKLNYQLYIAGAGKAQTKDDNNLYIGGEFEGMPQSSIGHTMQNQWRCTDSFDLPQRPRTP